MLSSSRRDKGNKFEYDTEYSLKSVYPDIRALEKRGYARGYDLISEQSSVVIECKFHKTITWNELVKYYELTRERATGMKVLVVFKTNQQPVLVFDGYSIYPFEAVFDVPFQIRPKGLSKGEIK
jgi:hypothetical protein